MIPTKVEGRRENRLSPRKAPGTGSDSGVGGILHTIAHSSPWNIVCAVVAFRAESPSRWLVLLPTVRCNQSSLLSCRQLSGDVGLTRSSRMSRFVMIFPQLWWSCTDWSSITRVGRLSSSENESGISRIFRLPRGRAEVIGNVVFCRIRSVRGTERAPDLSGRLAKRHDEKEGQQHPH